MASNCGMCGATSASRRLGAGMLAGAPAESKKTAATAPGPLSESRPQLRRFPDSWSKLLLPRARRSGIPAPRSNLEALVAPHIPQLLAIYGFESLDRVQSVSRSLAQHAGLRKKLAELESGPSRPTSAWTRRSWKPPDYSPEIAAPAPQHAAGRHLRATRLPLAELAPAPGAAAEASPGRESKIFHRSGVHPLFYSSTVVGANMPNLTYLIPFDSLPRASKPGRLWSRPGMGQGAPGVGREVRQISNIIGISLYRPPPGRPFASPAGSSWRCRCRSRRPSRPSGTRTPA